MVVMWVGCVLGHCCGGGWGGGGLYVCMYYKGHTAYSWNITGTGRIYWDVIT